MFFSKTAEQTGLFDGTVLSDRVKRIYCEDSPMSFNFFGVIRGITKGVGHLYRDSKTVWALRGVNEELLSRKELELVRSTKESLKKVGVFVVLQAPPIIGLLPIAASLLFPRQILTHHFWSPQEKDKFLKEEFNERKIVSENYIKELFPTMKSTSPGNLSEWLEIVHMSHGSLVLDDRNDNIEALACSQGLYSVRLAYDLLPNMYLLRRIHNKALNIAKDDIKLRKDGFHDLERWDLQDAAVRRGINPDLESEELVYWLNHWLHNQIDCIDSISTFTESPEVQSAFVHMIVGNLATKHAHPPIDVLHPKP